MSKLIILFVLGYLTSKIDSSIFEVLHNYYYIFCTIFIVLFSLSFLFKSTSKSRSKRFLKFSLACFFTFWGMYHSAPYINTPIPKVKVVYARVGSGTLFVKDLNNQKIYETQGKYNLNTQGSIRCFKPKNKSSTNSLALTKDRFCLFINDQRFDLERSSYLSRFTERIKLYIKQNLQLYLSSSTLSFVTSILYADKSDLTEYTKDQFRNLGIYHLLVISGLHFVLLASCIRWILFSLVHLLYVFRLLNPNQWIRSAMVLNVLVCIGSMLFLSMIEASSATKRACIIFLFHTLCPYITGKMPVSILVKLALLTQILVFPLGFISIATFLSWSSYLVFLTLRLKTQNQEESRRFYFSVWGTITQTKVLGINLDYIKQKITGLFTLIFLQLQLLSISVTTFGFLPVLSVVCNLILVPLFSVVMVCSLILGSGCLSWPVVSRVCVLLITGWKKLIDYVSGLDQLFQSKGIDWLDSVITYKILAIVMILTIFKIILKVFILDQDRFYRSTKE